MKSDPQQKQVAGTSLACLICGHDRFTEQNAQLNTRLATFMNLDFMNQTGTCFICERCGYIHWFLNP